MRIVFWGTSSFAVPALRALLGEGFDVVGVVTQPDRPVGRSRSTLVPSPVKSAALDEELPDLPAGDARGRIVSRQLRALEPELSVVVSYGHILTRSLIALPTLGTINVHASLLPALRGAAPIQGAMREGLTETGVTVMRMVQALDAGPIMLRRARPLRATRLPASSRRGCRSSARWRWSRRSRSCRSASSTESRRTMRAPRTRPRSSARWRASTGAAPRGDRGAHHPRVRSQARARSQRIAGGELKLFGAAGDATRRRSAGQRRST